MGGFGGGQGYGLPMGNFNMSNGVDLQSISNSSAHRDLLGPAAIGERTVCTETSQFY